MPIKVMLVDDDADFREVLELALKKYEFDVSCAGNGQEALSLMSNNPPDIVIADLTMPVMPGWHFTMKARQDPRFVSTPIIILSGLVRGEQEAGSESYDPNTYYVPKPFDIFKLVEKIKGLLNPSQSAGQK